MMEPKTILKLLTPTLTKAMEIAVGECVSRRHDRVGLEHVLFALTRMPDSDVGALLQRHQGASRFGEMLRRRLDAMPGVHAGKPIFAPEMFFCLREGWATLAEPRGDTRIRSGVALTQLLSDPARYGQEQTVADLRSIVGDVTTLDEKTLATLRESAEARAERVSFEPLLQRESVYHVVATGEALLAIARHYAVDVENLARLNGIGIHDTLVVGSTIKVNALPRDVVPR